MCGVPVLRCSSEDPDSSPTPPCAPPGYEGVPEFFNDLLNHITGLLQAPSADSPPATPAAASEPPKGPTALAAPPSPEPPAGGCGPPGKEAGGGSPWIVEGDAALKGARQRLGCNSAVSPNFQQHCVSTMATKASSQ